MGVGVGKGEEGRAKGRTFRFGGLRETEASLYGSYENPCHMELNPAKPTRTCVHSDCLWTCVCTSFHFCQLFTDH